jgi:PAT family beta-lactamase induction signal transducer AmpG
MSREHENPPWLFGILTVPTGVGYWGVNGLLIPYLLRQHGVSVDRIAGVVAIASIPGVWFFLASPVVDLGLKRRTWILLSCVCSALATGLAILQSAGSLEWVTGLLFTAIALGGVATAATGAVMTTIRPEIRGQASGWTQVGNVGAGALGGGVGVWMASFCGLPVLAAAAAVVMLIPALAALWIVEKPHPRMPPRRLFAELGHDIWDLLRSRRTCVGLLFFLSPVGAGAVAGLISSVAPDYHASNAEVAWVTGAGGGLLLAMGGLLGGFICDRMHRMTAYAVFGILAGTAGAWLALGPPTPFTYGAGFAAYALATGLTFAAFTALILEVLGHGRRAAATGYSLLFSSGNLPLAYMTWLDGTGYKHAGARGLMGVDALSNIAGGVLLLLLARYCIRRWQMLAPAAEVPAAV